MKMVLAACVVALLTSICAPAVAQPTAEQFDNIRDFFAGRVPEVPNLAPQSEGIAFLAQKAFNVTLYDPFTQKSFKTDKICMLADTEDQLSGIWVSSKDPDRAGFWVQWGNEIWIWGTDLDTFTYQVALIGRFLKATELTGQYTLFDFDGEDSNFGAFRLKKTSYNSNCKQFES